jgi:hypothetical protein
MTSSECPNPPCPSCKSTEVYEIVHDQAEAPEVVSTQSWVHYEGVCDIHPDKWKCGECAFRWYPRDIVERDLDLLTWQLNQELEDGVEEDIQARISVLRKVITTLANA